jgi:hypothetical protein
MAAVDLDFVLEEDEEVDEAKEEVAEDLLLEEE